MNLSENIRSRFVYILYILTLTEGINLIDLKLYDHKNDTMNIRGKYKQVIQWEPTTRTNTSLHEHEYK
jgi:hypothetical protein